jgi:hypothetical protein
MTAGPWAARHEVAAHVHGWPADRLNSLPGEQIVICACVPLRSPITGVIWPAGCRRSCGAAAGLASGRDGELVLVGWEVPRPVECCRGAGRDHALLRRRSQARSPELKPGAPQVSVVRNRRCGQLVDPHPHQHATGRGEALDSRRCEPGFFKLPARHQPHWSWVRSARRRFDDA